MTISRINVGNVANDGTGDDLRQAFVKVNNNFDDLNARVNTQNFGADNLGAGEGVFYTKENSTLYFKSLVAGDNISLTADGNSITITNNGNITIRTDDNTLSLSGAGRQFGINGGQNIDTTLSGNNVNVAINATDLIFQDKNPSLGAALNANNFNINNVSVLNATTINGSLVGTVNGFDVTEIGRIITGTDYGTISDNAVTILDILFRATSVDYGTIASPGDLVSDYGSIL